MSPIGGHNLPLGHTARVFRLRVGESPIEADRNKDKGAEADHLVVIDVRTSVWAVITYHPMHVIYDNVGGKYPGSR